MPENQNIEYKQIWKDDYFKQISAFANSDGGNKRLMNYLWKVQV